MKRIWMCIWMCWIGTMFGIVEIQATPGEGSDQTLAPYFFVVSGDSGDSTVDRLPLKSTAAQIDISGVIADVSITQAYKNEGQRPLEARYVFPASTRAAVYGMKMTIGERTIVARIDKRDAARKTYEAAREAGKSASLLTQERPNVFLMNVANILPGDVIAVELKYTELLVPTDAQYEFVFPTVVGPRYADGPAAGKNDTTDVWVKNPYLREGQPPANTLDLSVRLATGIPIQQIACDTHQVAIRYAGDDQAVITLDSSEKYGGNRDFILKYGLAGDRIESGLLLSRGKTENFFLLMLQPPKRVRDAQIPPREYIFIVDVSGSMNGFPLDISKKLLRDLIHGLRPTDRFNVLLFAGGATMLSEVSLAATEENVRSAVHMIDKQRGGGGTRLLPALQKALALPESEGSSRSIVIVTDGYVSVEKEAFDMIQAHLGKANVFPFGIGSSVNRHLIEGMARVGMGEPFIITRPKEAPAVARKFRGLIQYPVLTGIELDWGGFPAYDVSPAGVPDLLADRPVIVFGKWRGTPRGKVVLRGRSGNEAYAKTLSPAAHEPSNRLTALGHLWARHRIALLSDYNRLQPDDTRIEEVTELGLSYSLLTDYTAFVAVDSQVRNQEGKTTRVEQPLPLPRGVSNLAVGGHYRAKSGVAQLLMSPGIMKEKPAVPMAPGEVKNAVSTEASRDDTTTEVCRFSIESVAGLSRHSVAGTLRKHMDAFGGCRDSQKVQGAARVTVHLSLDARGRVARAEVKEKTQKTATLAACLVKALHDLRFPAPAGGGQASAVVTFSFRRSR